ncbi:hypothetical protein ABZ345_33175 [Lentzea sp. NPDC005914]|uniref:hypothetical protein n=1 Tax=Lentzea sp. NPDC005914 TaxID=3154572 RepID=UPI003406F2A7
MISEKANFRMRAALHAIRPGAVVLPDSLAAIVANGWIEHPSGAYLLRSMFEGYCRDGPGDDLLGYEARVNGWGIPGMDDLAELLGVSMAYARACLRVANRPVTALFSISEPYDNVIPVTTKVTFWVERPGVPYLREFENDGQPLMVLSSEETDFLYASGDEQEKAMAETAEALGREGLTRQEAVARVNEFWGEPSRRWALLYGGWIGQQTGEHWARLIVKA